MLPPTQEALDLGRARWHGQCVACGAEGQGLGLHCQVLPDGSVRGCLEPRPWMVGYDGIMHGGVVAMILDSAMTQCLFACGLAGLTATLHIRYRDPAPLDRPLVVTAHLSRTSRSLHRLEACITCGDRRIATAEAQFVTRDRKSGWPSAPPEATAVGPSVVHDPHPRPPA